MIKVNKKKKWLLGLGGAGLTIVMLFGGCGFAGSRLAAGIINNRRDVFAKYYPVVRWCGYGLPFVADLPKILNKTYIVLLQNSNELRATGGFPGSFARLTFAHGGMTGLTVQDIYEPDGKLPGHVEPPYPIQEAFGQGWWKLRDANWDPDFASAAATVAWFLRQGGETQVDGVVGVNLQLLKKWIGVLGGVDVQTFGVKVTEENLYSLAQTYAENRVSGDKTNKRQFLGALGAALLEKTKAANPLTLLRLGLVAAGELGKKQILVWVKDTGVEGQVAKMRWDGGLTSGWPGAGDYLYVVDTNLGANKSDCCIERQTEQTVTKNGKEWQATVKVTRKNNNPNKAPQPPATWGGQYVDYVRVIIPNGAVRLGKVTVDGKEIKPMTNDRPILNSLRQGRSEGEYAVEKRGDLQIIGFWLVVEAGATGTAEVEFASGRSPENRYEIFVKRQPGVDSFRYLLTDGSRVRVDSQLDRDRQFKIFW